MRKYLLIILCLSNIFSINAQAKKPKLLIVPSDNWCFQNDYTDDFNNQGIVQRIPNYRKALIEDSDLPLIISKLEELLQERNFAPENLERALKSVENSIIEEQLRESKETGSGISENPIDMLKKAAKADIIIQIGYSIKTRGPQRMIEFVMGGYDAYTDKPVANATNISDWLRGMEPAALAQRAIISEMDGFLDLLQSHFDDMFENGREVSISIRKWDDWEYDLESYFGDDEEELGLLIEDWIFENTVEGRFSTSDYTENMLNFEQVRIPLFTERNGRQRPMDTRLFARNLSRYLIDEFSIENKITTKGLGEATLILGSK